MNAYLLLLRYLATWLRPLVWILCAGAALLTIATVAAMIGQKQFAFGMSIYAYIALLVIPYVLAWYPLRMMLASRRVAMLPAFRLRLGLTMLLCTLVLAAFLPVASWLLWPGVVTLRFALGAFFAASLYTLAMQWAVASPYSAIIYSLGPVFVMFATVNAWPALKLIFVEQNYLPLAFVAACAWILALRTMCTRRTFRPPAIAPIHARDFIWDGRADLLGVLLGNFRGPVRSASGTLLLGMPDGFSGRFFNMLNLTFTSPLFGTVMLYLSGFAPVANDTSTLVSIFLGFSLMASAMSGLGNGELGARSRLVWLRQEGDRRVHWRRIESRLSADTLMLTFIVVPITGVVLLMFDDLAFDPLTYCVSVLACNVLGNYFSLAARLGRWSMLLQWFVTIAMAAGLILARVPGELPLPLLVALALGMALLFRQLAQRRFVIVDWQSLRPAGNGMLNEKLYSPPE